MSRRRWTASQLTNLSLSERQAIERIDDIDAEIAKLRRRSAALKAERARLADQVWGDLLPQPSGRRARGTGRRAQSSGRQSDILTPLRVIARMAAAEMLAALMDVWPQDRDRLTTHELADLLAGHKSGGYAWPEGKRTPELNARMRDIGLPPETLWIGGKATPGYKRTAVQELLDAMPRTVRNAGRDDSDLP